MIQTIGNKAVLGFELGELVEGTSDQVVIDIYTCGQRITAHDDLSYVPALISAIERENVGPRLFADTDYVAGLSAAEAHKKTLAIRPPLEVEITEENVKDDQIFIRHGLLNWGPNTDPVTIFAFPRNDGLVVTMSFYDSAVVHTTETTLDYLKTVLAELRLRLQALT